MLQEGAILPFRGMPKGRIGTSTAGHCPMPIGHGDADAAAEGVRLAYQAAGLARPEIVWCDDPLLLSHAWASAVGRDHVGADVRKVVFEQPCRAAAQRLAALPDAVARPVMDEKCRTVRAAVQSAVAELVEDVRPSLLAWIRRKTRPVGPRPRFVESGCGPLDLGNASLMWDGFRTLDEKMAASLFGLQLIADNAGWFVPHEHVCWLSSCPALLRTDQEGRLHCANGPALAYPRGLELFAWKGTPVPSWVIMQPEALTLEWIDAQIDPRVRHAMIDIFTPQRFVAAGGADRTARNATGTLWTRKWTHRGVTIDSWAAIEVAGSFHCVPAGPTRARDAFAWASRAPLGC